MSVWDVPVYLPYLQPDLTDERVAEAERSLLVKLPEAYLALLRVQNGGYLRRSVHGERSIRDVAGIGPHFPTILGHDWSSAKEAMAESGETEPADLDRLVPFSGDGHTHWCLDYRVGGEPRVTWVDVECFREEVVAPDFATFLEQLRAEPEHAIGLLTDLPGKKVAAALTAATGVKFADQGDQDHGYAVYRAQLPGSGNWAWLTPNRCRRGFVRKGDRRYKEVRDLMPELVDRFPEHADCGWFLTLSDPETKAAKALLAGVEGVAFGRRAVVLE